MALSPSDPRDIQLSAILDSYDAPPPSAGRVPEDTRFTNLRNNELRCCTIAGPGHMMQAWAAMRGEQLEIPDVSIERAYSAICGYVPGRPETDRGGLIINALTHLRQVGLELADGTHARIGGFARVDMRDRYEVRAAINCFGGIIVGADLPRRITSQRRWQLPLVENRTSDDRPRSLGGHCYLHLRSDRKTRVVLPWTQLIDADHDHEEFYVDEGWVVIDAEVVAGRRPSPAGFSVVRLLENLDQIGRG